MRSLFSPLEMPDGRRRSWLGRLLKPRWASLLVILALWQFSQGGYIYAKAHLAQFLIEDAWQQTLEGNDSVTPWPWADTYPVARLSYLNDDWYVLSGASGRVIAFGPGHMPQTPLPGNAGNSVIVGHRDTHFSNLAELESGQVIEVETPSGKHQYQVFEQRIAHQSQLEVIAQTDAPVLTLITCYPFDSITADTPYRYVVRAVLMPI